mmetsp:Transcript_34663/g.68393  ORF Transcript_34663/g.68393 Transcript_34663/m.68393 type:complete len:299 (-) Transcript_34663:6-902(-)
MTSAVISPKTRSAATRRWRHNATLGVRPFLVLATAVLGGLSRKFSLFTVGPSCRVEPGAASMAASADGTEHALSIPCYRGVLWDVDGTLVESTRLAFEATNAVLKKGGCKEVTESEYKVGSRYTTPRRFGFHVSGNADDPAGPVLAQEFDSLYVTQVSTATVPLFPGLKRVLEELESTGCHLGALSNACSDYVRAVVAVNGLNASFTCQRGADEVPAAKPEPAGLLQCCAELGLEVAECAYIGDAPTDGRAARQAGMRAIGVAWGSSAASTLEAECDEVVETVDQLLAALFRDPSEAT